MVFAVLEFRFSLSNFSHPPSTLKYTLCQADE